MHWRFNWWFFSLGYSKKETNSASDNWGLEFDDGAWAVSGYLDLSKFM